METPRSPEACDKSLSGIEVAEFLVPVGLRNPDRLLNLNLLPHPHGLAGKNALTGARDSPVKPYPCGVHARDHLARPKSTPVPNKKKPATLFLQGK
jgi:hypothetical protein